MPNDLRARVGTSLRLHPLLNCFGGLLLLFCGTTAAAPQASSQELFHLLCASSYTLLAPNNLADPYQAEPYAQLLQATARLPADLRAPVAQVTGSLQLLHGQLGKTSGDDLAEVSMELASRYNVAVLDALLKLGLPVVAPERALDNLPERMDYVLMFYVSWAQLGIFRPAQESQDWLLSRDLRSVVQSIDQDLQGQWLVSGDPAHAQLLSQIRMRWKYVFEPLANYRRAAVVPLNMLKQVTRISRDLRQLRAELASAGPAAD